MKNNKEYNPYFGAYDELQQLRKEKEEQKNAPLSKDHKIYIVIGIIVLLISLYFIITKTDVFKSSTDQLNEAAKPCVVISVEHNWVSQSSMVIKDANGKYIDLKPDNALEGMSDLYSKGDTIK